MLDPNGFVIVAEQRQPEPLNSVEAEELTLAEYRREQALVASSLKQAATRPQQEQQQLPLFGVVKRWMQTFDGTG